MDEELSRKVIGAAIEVHRCLGPGLLESTYELCLAKEFDIRGVSYERQREACLNYKGLLLERAYRLDFVIENELILEIKSVEDFLPIHTAQILTYLRLFSIEVGLIINFNVPVLKTGIKRVINSQEFYTT